MPQVAHLQYNSPADLYSRESAQEQFVQQIGDGAIPLPAPLPEKHFDPNRSATLRYIKEGDRNGYGLSLEEQIAAAEQPREYKSPEPSWANYAREKSERARSMTPGYHRAQSEPRDTWAYEYQRDSSKTPARDIDWREFQERTKTYVHDTKGGGVPYWAHDEFNQPNQTHRGYREKTPKGYECGGIDYRGNIHFDPPGPYDYVYTTKKKEEKRSRPGYEIGGTDFGTGYISSGPYHGHGPDPPRRRTKYTADPNAPVNVALAPNVDTVDPHLLVGDTVSNMKTGREKGSKEDGWMGLSYRNTEGFKRDHRATARRPELKQDSTFCTNYTRRSRSASAPRSSAPPEQRDVWRNRDNRENYDPYYHGVDKTVNVHTLLNDEALVPKRRETTPTWREKSLEKHYRWENREDPAKTRPMTWTREPNWTRTVEERRGAWENRAWDTEAKLALPASAKVRSEPPPSWHHNAQQKQSVWQSAANQRGPNSYTYAIPPGTQYTYQTTTTTTGPPPHQSEIAAQTYQNSYSSNYGDNNANYVANTGFNKTQWDYLEERRQKYGPGGHGGSGGYQQHQYTTNTNNTTNTTANQPQMQSYQSYNQQQQHQEQRETRKTTTTTTNVQNAPITRTTTYSYSQQPSSQPIALPAPAAFQTSHSSTTQTVRETSQPAAPVQNYQQQQYYQERREKTTSEERTTQPVQQIQQQQQWQQNQQQKTEHKTVREETLKPAQWWEQQQQQRRETKTTREEVTRPSQVQQQWHEQRHHRREETRTENVRPAQPVVQQQYWQQQSRREEKTTKEETHPVQPIVQQQYWQQQSRREEKTTKEETQPVQPIVQQQYWQQQSRKEEKTTREETRPAQPAVQQHWQSQQNYHKKTENRTENTQSYPLVSSNSGAKTTVVTSGPPVDRKLEMSETLPLGSLANTQANTEGTYQSPQGHQISYKRDLQTTADPGKEMALLKEEERRVVENELEPGVISRHITTKYYKKKTVTDTTTTTP